MCICWYYLWIVDSFVDYWNIVLLVCWWYGCLYRMLIAACWVLLHCWYWMYCCIMVLVHCWYNYLDCWLECCVALFVDDMDMIWIWMLAVGCWLVIDNAALLNWILGCVASWFILCWYTTWMCCVMVHIVLIYYLDCWLEYIVALLLFMDTWDCWLLLVACWDVMLLHCWCWILLLDVVASWFMLSLIYYLDCWLEYIVALLLFMDTWDCWLLLVAYWDVMLLHCWCWILLLDVVASWFILCWYTTWDCWLLGCYVASLLMLDTTIGCVASWFILCWYTTWIVDWWLIMLLIGMLCCFVELDTWMCCVMVHIVLIYYLDCCLLGCYVASLLMLDTTIGCCCVMVHVIVDILLGIVDCWLLLVGMLCCFIVDVGYYYWMLLRHGSCYRWYTTWIVDWWLIMLLIGMLCCFIVDVGYYYWMLLRHGSCYRWYTTWIVELLIAGCFFVGCSLMVRNVDDSLLMMRYVACWCYFFGYEKDV